MRIGFRKINENDFPFLRKVYRCTREEELSQSGMSEEAKSRFIEYQSNALTNRHLKNQSMFLYYG